MFRFPERDTGCGPGEYTLQKLILALSTVGNGPPASALLIITLSTVDPITYDSPNFVTFQNVFFTVPQYAEYVEFDLSWANIGVSSYPTFIVTVQVGV